MNGWGKIILDKERIKMAKKRTNREKVSKY